MRSAAAANPLVYETQLICARSRLLALRAQFACDQARRLARMSTLRGDGRPRWRSLMRTSVATVARLDFDGPPVDPADSAAEIADLRAALSTRDVIWEAKLIIAVATGSDAAHAQALLLRQSQHENRKLRDVAADIVERSTVGRSTPQWSSRG